MFLFTNKRRNSIKIVYYDTNGYWLFQKTLLNNDKFIWAKDECCDTIQLTKDQLSWLLQGMDIFPKHQFKPIKYI